MVWNITHAVKGTLFFIRNNKHRHFGHMWTNLTCTREHSGCTITIKWNKTKRECIGHISREHRITISTFSPRSAMIIQITSSYYHVDGFLLVWAELKCYWIKPSPQAVNIFDCNCWHGLSSPSFAACGCNCVTVCSNRAYVLMTEQRQQLSRAAALKAFF